MAFPWAALVLTYTFLLLPLSDCNIHIYSDCVFSAKTYAYKVQEPCLMNVLTYI